MPTLKELYNALVADGAPMPETYEKFENYMTSGPQHGYEHRKAVYDALKADGVPLPETYEAFSKAMFVPVRKAAAAGGAPAAVAGGDKPQAEPAATVGYRTSKGENVQAEPVAAAGQQVWGKSVAEQAALRDRMSDIKASWNAIGAGTADMFESKKKGGRLDAGLGNIEVNPATGKQEKVYYTIEGDRVDSKLGQSLINDAWNRNYEYGSEEGLRSLDQRLEREFDQRLGALWFEIEPKDEPNAAERAWEAAESAYNTAAEKNRQAADRNAMYAMNSADAVAQKLIESKDNYTDRLTTHDLSAMMQQAWDNLGDEGQKALVERCYKMYRNRYPGADELELYRAAEQLARQQSNQRLYNLAVQKNVPKSKLEFFARKMTDSNLVTSIAKGLARAQTGKTGDMEAYEDAMGLYAKDHKVLDVAGMVTGFALDPTTWISAGVGGAATKATLWGLGRIAAGRGATAAMTNAATRQISASLGGRVLAGMVGGSANFASFEGIKEAEDQFLHGGHVVDRDENGLNVTEGYSGGAIADQVKHGLLMGGAIGWLGPLSGNVSDKLVHATSSTVGKAAVRTGVFVGSTLAEGTIFSVPEWLSGKRDAYDVWTDNMAMMIGFKVQHGLKSAPRTIEEFGRTADGRKGMESRIREYLDRPSDGGMALTKDEKAELEEYGYDLNEMVRDAGDPTDAALVEARQEALPSKLTEMVTDPRLSEAVRAKMYYYATGRRLPMSTIMRGELLDDGNGGFIVQSHGANGVITSRGFKNRKAADLELERINRQAELNKVDLGEKYQQTEDFEKRLQDACRKVADENGWNAVDVYRLCSEARRYYKKGVSKEYDEAMQGVLNKVVEALGEYKDGDVTDAMRSRINEQYGVDIDKALAKEAKYRTGAEQAAIEQYIKELIPEKANEVSDVDAEDLTDQKLLGEEGEPIDPRFEGVADDNGFEMSAEDIDTWQNQQPIGRAVMKFEDRPVEVLSGRVVMIEDGSMVDKEQSDATIVIRDVATGNIEMCSPDDILTYTPEPIVEGAGVEPEPIGAEPSGDGGSEPRRKYGAGIISIRNSDGSITRGYLTGHINENGEYEYLTEGNKLHYASEHDLDNIVAEYKPDRTAEPIVAKDSQGNELAVGDEIILSAGRRGVVQEIHPDGRVTVDHEGDIVTYNEAYGDITSTGLRKVAPEAQPAEQPTAPTEPQSGARVPDGMTADRTISVAQRDGSTREYTVAKDQAGKQYVVDESGFMWGHDGNGENMKPYRPGESVSEWTDEQIARLSQPAQPSDAVPEQSEIVPTSAESGENAANIVPDPAETVLTEQPAAEPTPLQRVPKDANGEPKFEATDHETAWDALVEYSEGDAVTAKEIADAMVEEKKKALDKAQKLKLKGKTPAELLASKKANAAELDKAQKEFEQWQRIAGVEQRRKDAERSAREAEARQRAAERAAQEAAERAAREEAERIEREALNGVPEWHQDTPENARARGFRRYNGQKWERQEPLQGVVGKEVEVKFSSTDLPKGRIAVIEASQLQPSHIQGDRNPLFFIDEAQPKNRTDDISKMAAKVMAEDIRPQEITVSPTAYSGAPTVNTRGEVIQGNNRSDALRYLWENSLPEQQGKYKQFLIDNAEQFGIDPAAVEQMQQPVLVNMLDVDDAEAIRLGQLTANDTESGGIERIKAKNVAQKLGDNMRQFANMLLRSEDEEASFGMLVDRNGVDVLKWMNQIGAITPTQYQSAFDSKGNITAEAKNDLGKVLYQAVFKGANQQLEELFDKLPAKAQRAILSTAFRDLDSPFSQKMLGEIQASIRAYTELMSDANFANAKKLEEVLRAVQAWTQQTALDDRFETVVPADNYSNFALRLAAMYKASDYSQKTIATTFNEMYDMIQGTVKVDLFNPEPDTTPRTLAEAIREKLGIDYQPAKNDIDNGRNGSTDVALDHQPSEAGQRGSSEPSASGEPAEGGEEPADGGGRATTDSEAATEQPAEISETASVDATESVQHAVEAASAEVNVNPTPAQAEAGNYKKGHVKVADLDITIENPKGSVRSGVDADGKAWSTEMKHTYGYIRGTKGKDGDHIDVYLADDMDAWDGKQVYVIDQTNPDGTFDEHKVMIGFRDVGAAWEAYHAAYSPDWWEARKDAIPKITPCPIEEFKDWLGVKTKKAKPFAEYSWVEDMIDTQREAQTVSGEGYTIAPKPYTNKQGKTLDTYLVRFDRDFSKEEMSALRAKAKAVKGWYDRESRGWMLRSAEDAKAFAEEVMSKSEDEVADEAPLSIKEAKGDKGLLTLDNIELPEGLSRRRLNNIGDDARMAFNRSVLNADFELFDGKDATQREIAQFKAFMDAYKDIAGEYSFNRDKEYLLPIFDHFNEQLNAVASKSEKPTEAPAVKKVDVSSVADALRKKGSTKLSDHAEPITDKTPKPGDHLELTDGTSGDVLMRHHEQNAGDGEDNMTGYTLTDGRKVKPEDIALQGQQPKPKKRNKWISDEDAAEFGSLMDDLRRELGGGDIVEEEGVGYGNKPKVKPMNAEVLRKGTVVTYMMMKGGLRKFSDYCEAMVDELGDAIRPHLKSLYAATQNMEEVIEAGWDEEMDDRKTVKGFDVYNFDKQGAVDLIETAQHVVDEQASAEDTEKIINQLKDQRNEQRRKEADETSADTAAIVDKAEAAASEVEDKLENAADEETAEALAETIDKNIEAVNKQLALLGYYEADAVDKDYNEAYGYMRNAERKATQDAHRLATQLATDLGLTIDTKDKVKNGKSHNFGSKLASSNIAPAGGEVNIRLPLNAERELYIRIALDPVDDDMSRKPYRQSDDLHVTGIMYRVEGKGVNASNNFAAPETTYDDLLADIKRVVRHYLPEGLDVGTAEHSRLPQPGEDYVGLLPGEDYLDMAERLSKAKAPKERTVEPEQTMGSLFDDIFGEQEDAESEMETDFVEEVSKRLGREKMNITTLRKIAKDVGLEGRIDTDLQELTELAIVNKAREIAKNAPTLRDGFNQIVELYKSQPTISQRSSERVAKQQYSTPIPLGYMADAFINVIRPKSVLEPSGGNGMMIHAIDPGKVHANDIDKMRLKNLRRQGFAKVTDQDGREAFKQRHYHAIVTNSPFGQAKVVDYDGFPISGLEKQMSINALNSMRDDGRAAIIIGGNTEYDEKGRIKGADRIFFNYLYSRYNVVDVINVSGEMYSRQGTSYPVRMILIDGRRPYPAQEYAPRRANARAEQVTTFDELFNRINDELLRSEELSKAYGDSRGEQGGRSISESGDSRADDTSRPDTSVSDNDRERRKSDTTVGGHSAEHGNGTRPATYGTRRTGGRGESVDGSAATERPGRSVSAEGKATGRAADTSDRGNVVRDRGRSANATNVVVGAGDGTGRVTDSKRLAEIDVERQQRKEDKARRESSVRRTLDENPDVGAVEYISQSNAREIGSTVPANQAQPISKALKRIGDVDEFLRQHLGYADMGQLYAALSAEQIDSVALAITQMANSKGFIIGDMTGVGKGRQAAAIIRWAVKAGHKPIFMTEKANLFSDIYRDLTDIGSGELRPLIINAGKDADITDSNGEVVHRAPRSGDKALKRILESGKIPDEYDFVIMTYSQLNAKDMNAKKTFFMKIAAGNYLVMDESHNAGGDGNTGTFLQNILSGGENSEGRPVRGVTFLSGTFAKRPDNMPIYALKTDIGNSGLTAEEMIQTIIEGGVPLQEIMSRALASSGQMVRRERDFTGVTVDWTTIGNRAEHERQEHQYDSTIGLFNRIIQFQEKYVTPIIEMMDAEIAAQGKEAGGKKGTKKGGVDNQPLFSKIFLVTRQLMFAMKADAVADMVIEQLRQGKKPVVAVDNTMESFADNHLPNTGEFDMPTIAMSYEGHLESCMQYTVKDAQGHKSHSRLHPGQLSPEGRAEYNKIIEEIHNATDGVFLSPIDRIKSRVRSAGYSVAELTGRKYEIQETSEGRYSKVPRTDTDKKKSARDFNNGEVDVLILNKSASTGISLHSSKQFGDQRQRVMIIAQPQLDVNTEVQMRGRIDRTGQIWRGHYIYAMCSIPAESRLIMMLKAKLKSLDANTKSSQKSEVSDDSIVDFLNKYGDEICLEYLKEHRELADELYDPLHFEGKEEGEIDAMTAAEGTASIICGRVALLSSARQREFYDEIGRLFTDKINYLNEIGENELVISSLPLAAETKATRVFQHGKDPGKGNEFAEDSIMEECEVNVLRKPLKMAEIQREQERLTDGYTNSDEYKRHLHSVMEEHKAAEIALLNERLSKKLADAKVRKEASIRKEAEKLAKKSGREIDEAEVSAVSAEAIATVEKEHAGKADKMLKALNNRYEAIHEQINSIQYFDTCTVPNKIGIVSSGSVYAYVIGVKIPKTGSKLTLICATLDGRRKVEIPFSDAWSMNNVYQSKFTKRLDPLFPTVSTWDKSAPTATRETMYIATGNLLQAYPRMAQGSKIVNFTDKDGNIRQGIIMPKWAQADAGKLMTNTIEPFENIGEAVAEGKKTFRDTHDEVILGWNQREWAYELVVPKSKTSGGKYYLDDGLKSLLEWGGNFQQRRNSFVAVVKRENVAKVAKYLSDKFNLKAYVPIEDESDAVSEPEAEYGEAEARVHGAARSKGLREISGEEGYGAFLRGVYEVMDNEGRRAIASLAGETGYDFEAATGRYLAELAEKEFEDFTPSERALWVKLRDKALAVVAGEEKMPRWVKLGDNELRYMLWKDSCDATRGNSLGTDYVAMAEDVTKRAELGLDEVNERRKKYNGAHPSLFDASHPNLFDASQGLEAEAKPGADAPSTVAQGGLNGLRELIEENKAELTEALVKEHEEVMLGLEEGERTGEDLQKALVSLDDAWQQLTAMYGEDPADETASSAITSMEKDMRKLRSEIYAKAKEENPESEVYVPNDGHPILYERASSKYEGLLTEPLPALDKEKGEYCFTELQFEKEGYASFTAGNGGRIESADDVAYMFRKLESASDESVFAVLVKNGEGVVLHLGTGGRSSSAVNFDTLRGGVDRLQPDVVYLLHNHPSGTMRPSVEDTNLIRKAQVLSGKAKVHGLIIDTWKKEYVEFGDGLTNVHERVDIGGEQVPVSTWRMSETTFDMGYKPDGALKTSRDVAELVANRRLAASGKVGYVIVNRAGEPVANICTDRTELGDVERLGEEIISNVTRFGGSGLMMYGSSKSMTDGKELRELNKKLSGVGILLNDSLYIKGRLERFAGAENQYESSAEYGLLEPGAKYEKNNAEVRDPGETDDIWQDGSLGLEERITNASIRLSNNQRGDLTLRNDAMRAVCDNLQTLLHDMRNRSGRATSFGGADAKVERGVAQSARAQRLYDQVTAKRVGDLARVLMQNGYLRDMTSGEMQRIVSALKNATGAEDIANSVEKIMDIMIDNQVRSGKEALSELMSIRGSRVDSRGVEVQGTLDADGARMMQAVRRGMKLSEAEIQNKIAEAVSRMGDSDQTIADDAALEYAGMQIALDYVQNITGSKNEEKDLRDSLKEAKAEKDAGRMTADAYNQLVEATEDAIRRGKIERAEAYTALVGRLSDSMRQSIENARAWREAEKRRIQEIQHNANSDMQGMPSEMHRGKDTWKDGASNLLAATAFAPLATFEQMIRGIAGSKAADGEGYLYNRFVRGLNDARAKEISGYRGKQKKLDDKVREIFNPVGGTAGHSRLPHKGKVKSWGDVIRLERKLPKMRVTYFDKSANDYRDAELMQGNLLYIYMVDKMSDGRMKLRKMGITESDVDAIADFLDPRIKALGDWLQEEFLVETRNEYNETHKRMFGTSMAAIDNYFPLKILGDARGIKEDIDSQDTIDGATSTVTGAIKKRKVNTLALDILGADALNVVLDHLAEMEHWNAYAELGRDMNALLSYGKFRNRVKNMRTVYGAGEELWKRFKDVSRIAFGTYHQEVNDFDEGFLKIARGVTAAKVAFRLNTALKQTLSLPALIPDMSVSGLIEGLKNPCNPFTWCMENLPVFEERWRSRISGDPRLMKSERGWNDWRNNVVEIAGRWGMTPNAFIDAVICSVVAKTIYDTKLRQYIKDGYAQTEAEARAKQDASIGYNLSQQSSEGAYLAPIQAKKNWLSVMWTVFRNSPMSYTRQVFDSVRNLKRNLTPGKHAEQIEYMTKQTLREWQIDPDNGTDQERTKAKERANRRYSRSLMRDALRLLTYGFVLPGLWSLGGYWLYMLLGNDEEEKQQMKDDIYARLSTAPFEGLTGGDVLSNMAAGYINGTWNESTMTKDMPLTQDLTQIAKKLFKEDKRADALNDIFNLCVQSGFGFNPATIENAVLGIMDACGNDVQLANEATIVAARILNCPESQVKKLYFDEIGMSGEEASKLSPAEIAERYARMQVKLGRPIMPWLWDDEAAIDKKMSGRYGTLTAAKERFKRQGDASVKEAYAGYCERYKAIDQRVKAAKEMMETDYVAAAAEMAEVQADPDFTLCQQFHTLDKQLTKLAGMWIKAGSGAEAEVIARAVNDYRAGMVKVLGATSFEEQQAAMAELQGVMQQFSTNYAHYMPKPQSQQIK